MASRGWKDRLPFTFSRVWPAEEGDIIGQSMKVSGRVVVIDHVVSSDRSLAYLKTSRETEGTMDRALERTIRRGNKRVLPSFEAVAAYGGLYYAKVVFSRANVAESCLRRLQKNRVCGEASSVDFAAEPERQLRFPRNAYELRFSSTVSRMFVERLEYPCVDEQLRSSSRGISQVLVRSRCHRGSRRSHGRSIRSLVVS